MSHLGRRRLLLLAFGAACACGGTTSSAPPGGETTGAPKADDPKVTGVDSTGAETGSSSGGSSGLGSSSGSGSSSGGSSTGIEPGCPKNVVLMGYWPPTNEMLRPFSTDPALNPDGWVGENWRELGFDVYAFFPEFPPDGDPANDPIGAPGSVGVGDLQVDYQDTSADFWAITDTLQPHIIITHSRGGAIGWELEAIEGGHGNGAPDPALDWISDGFGDETWPSETSVDPRSWAAINRYRDRTAASLLPLDAIEMAAGQIGSTTVQIDTTGTSGNYLSGFLGLHGIVYAESARHAVAGGHIHVGIGLPVEDARALVETSLEVVLQTYPASTLSCPSRP